ncbi:MAG: hypothetical protein FWC73_10265 [Defluviitaleaceae bacterium]|nr:hypothetical protein [Defluviitaleaceae bacterium]
MESTLSKYANKMIIVIVCASLLMVVGGAVFLRSFLAVEFGFGILLACGLNIVKVLLLKRAVDKATTMEHGISAYTGGMYMLRFLLTGVVLVAAYFLSGDEPLMVFFGAALGLLAMPIASYALRFFIKDEGKVSVPVNDANIIDVVIDEIASISEDDEVKE